jgi:hypothetical protein
MAIFSAINLDDYNLDMTQLLLPLIWGLQAVNGFGCALMLKELGSKVVSVMGFFPSQKQILL